MAPILLILFSILVLIIWMVRFKQTFDYTKGPHILDDFSLASIPSPAPKISIIIPARNEEENIETCIDSLLKQDYPDFEILVVNDRSIDRTGEIISRLDKENEKVQAIHIESLPEFWTGKNNALFTAVKQAKGEWYLFTDADTIHHSNSVSMAMGHAYRRKAKMLSLTPSLENVTFWEKVLQPLAGGALMLRFPLPVVNDPEKKLAFGNGQFILIEKETYFKVGGHEKVKGVMLEDVALAHEIKSQGFSLHVGYGAPLFKTRMYAGFKSIFKGWVRIYHSAFNKNLLVLFSYVLLIWLVSISPYLLGLYSLYLLFTQFSFFSILLFGVVVFQFLVMLPTLWNTYHLSRSDPAYIPFHGLACVILSAILFDAFLKIFFKLRVPWRGDHYLERR